MSAARTIPTGRRLRYAAEAAAFFLAMGFFRLLGIERAAALGGWLGRTLAAPSPASRLARTNLRAAFPELSYERHDAILRGTWDNLGRVFGEYAHLDKVKSTGAAPRIRISGSEHVEAARASGKGLLLISGHFANWEIMPTVARDLGLPGATVVRPTNNPYVNRWIETRRTANGMPELIAKGASGTRRVFSLLRRSECICMLVDQRTSEGIPVPFFDMEALTTPVPAALAQKLGAVILPVSNERLAASHFHVRIHPPIMPPETGDAHADVAACMAEINAFLEARVREHPEQWLWIHRRWVNPGVALRTRRALAYSANGTTSTTSRGT
jgi:KDO2-lipid IV(A) lauroyltransferase